ncbi:hypothetical protein ACOSP7_017316 [Xanthoceras sorbifolium]
MLASIKKSSINSFADSSFVDAISLIEMQRKFNDHITHVHGSNTQRSARSMHVQRIWIKPSRSSSTWYTNLPNNSIALFVELNDIFVEQFASSQKLEKQSDDLYTISQHRGELLRDYVGRFNKENVSIPHCNQAQPFSLSRKDSSTKN